MNRKKIKNNISFFNQFSKDEIIEHWNNSETLLELAQKLGFQGSTLSHGEYVYIETFKTRDIWNQLITENQEKERSRPGFVKQLSAKDLQEVMDSEGIETVKHLAVHYLLSEKHGRKVVRERALELNLVVKASLHKGFYGVSATPIHWPTSAYEKRKGPKPMTCPECNFTATKPEQIEIHHHENVITGPKERRDPDYFRSTQVELLCRNCHSLKHRSGERLQAKCGSWRPKPPGTQRYENPTDIFSSNCKENYRMQKNYYLKWFLEKPEDYFCQVCGVTTWGKANNVLSLELHHKDNNHENSFISNLQLLCPNCHRAV